MNTSKSQLIKSFNNFNIKSLKTNEKIYLLKVLYSYYEVILNSYYGSGLFFLTSITDDLNDSFKLLRRKIMQLFNSDNIFIEIRNSPEYNEAIEKISSLYSDKGFLNSFSSITKLREMINDKDLFENELKTYEFDDSVPHFLKSIESEIVSAKKNLDEKTNNYFNIELFKNKEQPDSKEVFYITKEGDDFIYKGRLLDLSKTADYYTVFCALYDLRKKGGEITYKELISEIKNRIPTKKHTVDVKMRKFIQSNLTDKSNGFVRYAKISPTEDNSKPLIKIKRGVGVIFNNTAG